MLGACAQQTGGGERIFRSRKGRKEEAPSIDRVVAPFTTLSGENSAQLLLRVHFPWEPDGLLFLEAFNPVQTPSAIYLCPATDPISLRV